MNSISTHQKNTSSLSKTFQGYKNFIQTDRLFRGFHPLWINLQKWAKEAPAEELTDRQKTIDILWASAKKSSTTFLSLSNLNASSIPDLSTCTHVQKLSIFDSKIKHLDSKLLPPNLTEIDISDNEILKIDLTKINRLTKIILYKNKASEVCIGNQNLECILCHGNRFPENHVFDLSGSRNLKNAHFIENNLKVPPRFHPDAKLDELILTLNPKVEFLPDDQLPKAKLYFGVEPDSARTISSKL